jgi:hypothetical protein
MHRSRPGRQRRGAAHADRCPKQRPAAAPVFVLRVHVGAVPEQRRCNRRVPVVRGEMERRGPAKRARVHTASASLRQYRVCVRERTHVSVHS